MNKTLYIRDEDVPLWERARSLAGDKLSPVIVEALKRFVAEKEVQPRGFDRIEVRYEDSFDNHIPKAKAFYGRWIFPPSKPLDTTYEDGDEWHHYAVAVTHKGAAVIFKWRSNGEIDRFDEQFLVFDSLDAAASDRRVNYAARRAIKEVGVPVEELDI